MRRRDFLSRAGGAVMIASGLHPRPFQAQEAPPRELRADLVIAGGGFGGCAAALAALHWGLRVILTEETDWLGGQITQQGVPPDEHPWIESFGAPRSYRELRERIRRHYRDNYPLASEARRRPHLNPGNGRVSRLCCEPRAALRTLEDLLAPHRSGGSLRVLLEHRVVGADVDGSRIKALKALDGESGKEIVLRAPWFIDATELGDVLPLAGVEHVTGAESRKETGEPHAPEAAQPENHQAFTCCFAMDYLPDEDHTIEPPAGWKDWRDYVPKLTPAWPGRLLSFEASDPITLAPRRHLFDPVGEAQSARFGLWTYRRIADKRNFEPGAYAGDITLVNWPQNDYWLGNLYGGTPVEASRHVERAKELSLCLLYWLQTEAPRPDGGVGFKGLRLRPDVLGTSDGLAKRPYVRESRRIRALFTVREEHVGLDARTALTGKKPEEVTAEAFPDSVGLGSYRIDLHPSTGGDNYIDVSSLPFQIPLGSLIPLRIENLLAGAKNLGVTHITNGCYRLHPVEWGIGEAAGSTIAFAHRKKLTPQEVRGKPALLEELQAALRAQGVETHWPKLRPL